MARAAGLKAELRRVSADDSASEGPLPVWYLDLLHTPRLKLVLGVETGTRWAFVLPAAPFATLMNRFPAALFEALIALGLPADRARMATDSGQPYRWARLTDRSVQAHLRQYKNDAAWLAGDGASITAVNARLAAYLITAPRQCWPGSEVLRLLGGDAELLRRQAAEEGRQWREAFDMMQAQAGGASLRLPLATLLHTDRLDAAHEARVLFVHVPGSQLRHRHPGQPQERPPQELVLDFDGIHAVGPAFVGELAIQIAAHAWMRLRLEGMEPAVASALLD